MFFILVSSPIRHIYKKKMSEQEEEYDEQMINALFEEQEEEEKDKDEGKKNVERVPPVCHPNQYNVDSFDSTLYKNLRKKRKYSEITERQPSSSTSSLPGDDNFEWTDVGLNKKSTGGNTKRKNNKYRIELHLAVKWEGFEIGHPFPSRTTLPCRHCLGSIKATNENPLGLPLGLPISKDGFEMEKLRRRNRIFIQRKDPELGNSIYYCIPLFCSPACVRAFNASYEPTSRSRERWIYFLEIMKYYKLRDEKMNMRAPRELMSSITGGVNEDLRVVEELEKKFGLEGEQVHWFKVPIMYVTPETIARTAVYKTNSETMERFLVQWREHYVKKR